jgi:peptidoglycan/xylan/chitin deacetylase (PgdA/CDA1 family)
MTRPSTEHAGEQELGGCQCDGGLTEVLTLHGRPVVLMYHGFATERRVDDHENLFVPEAALRAQLAHLQRRRFQALDLDGYLRALDGRARPGRSFLFTADDGYRSFVEIGAPLLLAAQVPSLLFVPPALLGGGASWMPDMADEPLLAPDDLRGLAELGVEVGVHGLDHTTLVGLSDAELSRQTRAAREQVADLTGAPPRAFAFPYGAFDRRACRAVEAAGFEVAFSVFDDAGRYAISRVDVNATDNQQSFRFKLIPGYRRWWRASNRLGPARRTIGRLLRGPTTLARSVGRS